MRIETASGLHGELVAYDTIEPSSGKWAIAIVLRDRPTFPEKPYSTHVLNERDGVIYAQGGVYDLTLDEARENFEER